MRLISVGLAAAGLIAASSVEVRNAGSGSDPYAAQLSAITSSLSAGLLTTAAAASAIGDLLLKATPTASPSNYQEWQQSQKAIFGTQSGQYKDLTNASFAMLATGAGGAGGLQNYLPVGSVCPGENCDNNSNPPPRCFIYPRKSFGDAPYSLSEDVLRGAIYIPEGFSYGANGKQPVLLVPGTASFGGVNFQNNFRKILDATSYAEPFWLNIPGAQLGDAQLTAEHVAYAINYMQCQSGKNIATLNWSQGSINTQWALKYWPSTRSSVTDLISISGDYHGTILANGLCLLTTYCDPSVIQQEYNSNFITTLRKSGGDSAYIPTTNIYSALLDEIVEPQQDPNASGALNDARRVGVTNTQVQTACQGQPGGSLYGHESVLFNPIAAALALDALQHDGPGQLSRINKTEVCANYIASPLTFEDALFTEGLIPLAGYYLITYTPKSNVEAPIKAYARYS